jgi:hypothetical protein
MEPSNEAKVVKASPKEIFLHLFSIVALYVTAIAVGTLLFQIVNLSIHDALEGTGPWVGESARSAMRFAISSLVVAFPAYLWSLKPLRRGYVADAARGNVRIRKWLTYLTLFVAGLVVLSDAIAVIHSFLGGELTVRFFLKALSLGVVAASVFLYYRWDLQRSSIE